MTNISSTIELLAFIIPKPLSDIVSEKVDRHITCNIIDDYIGNNINDQTESILMHRIIN